MQYMDTKYNTIGVIKSQICSAIVNSESVRKAIDFKGNNIDDYDPDDPFSLIHTCVFPYLQNPDVITTTEPLIFVGVELTRNNRNPYLINAIATIVCSVDKDDMKTPTGYFREDLLESGCICYTRTDWMADEIVKTVSFLKGTWIGDIEIVESTEKTMSNTRYCRIVSLKLQDVNIGALMQNG